MKEGLGHMIAILGSNLAEKTAKLLLAIALNCNPLKTIFGDGPDLADISDRAGEVANAASKLAKGKKLAKAIRDLSGDVKHFAEAFAANGKQIKSMAKLVDKIKNGTTDDIDENANAFLKDYGAYIPNIDRSTLAANDALWSAFKEAMCDEINGDVEVAGSVARAITDSAMLCERLDGTLAQFFTLREDIFDFQFQLIDSLAAITRGVTSRRYAKKINGQYDSLPASDVMAGFMMSEIKLQAICSVFCDSLEFRNGGTKADACVTDNGFYSNHNVDKIISYSSNTQNTEYSRVVQFPTKVNGNGETGVISLQLLARQKSVIFKVPRDRDWLVRYGWILPYEDTIPYVKSLKLFLPKSNYSEQPFTTSSVTLTSVAGSSLSLDGPVYFLPPEVTKYRTLYEEGYSSCDHEIENPYSLCENLPKICDKTNRISCVNTWNPLLPTILSTFKLDVRVSQGVNEINYTAPIHETQLLLRAKATLLIPDQAKKKTHIPDANALMQSDVVVSKDGCCDEGNSYRTSVYDFKCAPCPNGTISMLRGLYCQPKLNKCTAQ